ncbi:MAG: hypothetical protein GF355_18220 [Candidatus Eisenbacteria bacterium]|nr:hypothetical protein [Candidatus Eisenbacteria bacterium]
MSKRKKTRSAKRRSPGKAAKPPVRRTSPSGGTTGRKLSEIIKEMALRLMKDPDADFSEPAIVAALMLAGAAWNSAIGDDAMREDHRKMLDRIDWDDVTPWQELRGSDTERLIGELVDYKRAHHPNDMRRIVTMGLSPEGNVQVQWAGPEKTHPAQSGGTRATARAKPGKAGRGHPIADKLVKKMKRQKHQKVIDLRAVMAGRKNAEELQKTVATREELADFHPAHAIYVYAQNQLAVMSEQLTALKDMERFVKLISKAEEEYMPSGPPMSPLTTSFFTCWALLDACVGQAEETIGTIAMAVGSAFGMHEELLRVIGLMQSSRMAVYAHEGRDNDSVVLRELVTDHVCKAIYPSGYRGRRGELWYVRVLPPPLPDLEEHVVFTTPYVLIDPGEREWLAYFNRTLPEAPREDRVAAYERHMKFGPARDYWTEFVLEAYVNHTSDVVFLKGLPDIPESRPHSRVNR